MRKGRPISQPTIANAEQKLWRANHLKGRIRKYGYPCLTQREFEAIAWERHMLDQRGMTSAGNKRIALQSQVATQLRISQPRVSKILKRADEILLYLEDKGLEIKWVKVGNKWQFNAPIEPMHRGSLLLPSTVKPPEWDTPPVRSRRGRGLAAR